MVQRQSSILEHLIVSSLIILIVKLDTNFFIFKPPKFLFLKMFDSEKTFSHFSKKQRCLQISLFSHVISIRPIMKLCLIYKLKHHLRHKITKTLIFQHQNIPHYLSNNLVMSLILLFTSNTIIVNGPHVIY